MSCAVAYAALRHPGSGEDNNNVFVMRLRAAVAAKRELGAVPKAPVQIYPSTGADTTGHFSGYCEVHVYRPWPLRSVVVRKETKTQNKCSASLIYE